MEESTATLEGPTIRRPVYPAAMTWKPVLDGALAEEARAAALAIADEISRLKSRRHRVEEALLWAYVAGAFDDAHTASCYDDAITALQERLESPFSSYQLHGGLAGAGWVLAHITDDAGEFLGEVDLTLLRALREPWPTGHDLIVGLAGIGMYFVERVRAGAGAETARSGVARVIEQLAAMADELPEGVAWLSRPELLPAWQLAISPSGHYDLGVAHGVPGVIAYLGKVAALDDPALEVVAGQASALCERAVGWFRSRSLPPDPLGRFSSWVMRGSEQRERARTAWCYGDPGIAAALWSAAIHTGADATEWRQLALECTRRPAERSGVVDVSLCHGAAGLAHIYNRFFQASGDERFRQAARDWFERTLAMRRPGEGIAGFTCVRARNPGVDNTLEHQAVSDFLDGAAGVALALVAGLGAEEPGWDRLLLCDVPPLPP
jgi:lantibiotic biosynthesis protein